MPGTAEVPGAESADVREMQVHLTPGMLSSRRFFPLSR